MVRSVNRRDMLKGIGTASVAGLAGCIGGPGGSEAPDLINIIGYTQDGIQLFKDFYETADPEETKVLVPDGLRDAEVAKQTGVDLSAVRGTAPASGGPNQEAFNSLYQDTYDTAPSVFNSQSYDSVAIQILANAAAGENTGTGVRDQMRRMANPGGMEVGPNNFAEGVEAAANGDDIDFRGASSSVNFDENGDPAQAAYALWKFTSDSTETIETQNFEGSDPEGGGAMADSGPGGMGRTIKVGILLPETGNLGSIGSTMIRAAQLPAQQVNDAGIDLEVQTQVEDTQTTPSQGVSGAQSLVNAGFPSVCGTASSGVNVPTSKQVFIPNQVVGCSPSSTALSVTNLDDDDYIFRTAPSDRLQGRVMAQIASERMEASTVSTLYVNNDYGQQLSERFSNVFADQFDGEVWHQVAYNQGKSSYTSVIEEALSAPS